MSPDYLGYWDERYREATQGSGGGTYGAEGSWTRNELYKVVSDLKAETVTDIGCGDCSLWDGQLPVADENYLGIDISPFAIREARQRHPKASFLVEDVANLAYGHRATEGWNDLLICSDVMFHLAPPDVRKLYVWMFQTAKKGIAVKSVYGMGDTPSSFHWDHTQLLSVCPKGWSVSSIQTHPHNRLARFIVMVAKKNA